MFLRPDSRHYQVGVVFTSCKLKSGADVLLLCLPRESIHGILHKHSVSDIDPIELHYMIREKKKTATVIVYGWQFKLTKIKVGVLLNVLWQLLM